MLTLSDDGPEPRRGSSGAEGFVPSLILSLPTFPCLAASHHLLGLPQKSRKSSAMNTYKKCACNPFRMNTCKTLDLKSLCFQHLQKIGGGAELLPLVPSRGSLFLHLFCLAGHRPPVYPKLLSQRAPSFTLFAKSENYLASIQSFAHSLHKTPGCTLF